MSQTERLQRKSSLPHRAPSRDYRSTPLARLFKIVMLMHGGGHVTQRDLAQACECSDRQIRRYLNALEQAGVPFDTTRKRGYFLDPDWSPFHLSLNLMEVLALMLARQAVVGHAELPFAHSAQTAFDKVAALLPSHLRDRLEADQAIAFHNDGKRNYAEAPWGQLLTAMHRRETLEMEYYTISRDTTSVRHVDPYHIVWLQSYCHLIGYCHTRCKVINFALDGIRYVKPTGAVFTVQKDFSLADYLRGAAGPILGAPVEIVVRFDAELARYARRRNWVFPHTLTDEPDGAVLLRGTVRGLDDMRKELLTWGRHARVLEPTELRDSLLAEARAIAALYTPE
jgi:predicted DNA-binding transcriptional regulator YafY